MSRREKAQDDPFVRGAKYETDRVLDDDAMWANYEYFIKAVIPVAEEAGVRLCLHPDDPPVPTLGGIARLFRSIDGLRRGREIASSPAWALDLCLGTVSEMGGEAAVLEALETFGPSGDIAYLHMRDVKGTVPAFHECFIGEGNYDPAEVVRAARPDGLRRVPDRRPRAADARRHAVLPSRSGPRGRLSAGTGPGDHGRARLMQRAHREASVRAVAPPESRRIASDQPVRRWSERWRDRP